MLNEGMNGQMCAFIHKLSPAPKLQEIVINIYGLVSPPYKRVAVGLAATLVLSRGGTPVKVDIVWSLWTLVAASDHGF